MLQLSEFEFLAEKLNNGLKLSRLELDIIGKLRPEKSLIVYGSLAPGERNHHVMSGIQGEWMDATTEGIKLEQGWGSLEGYPGMTFRPKADRRVIKCKVLLSEDLIYHWERLDQFEGVEYIRQIWPFSLEDGQIGMGSIYAIRHPIQSSLSGDFLIN